MALISVGYMKALVSLKQLIGARPIGMLPLTNRKVVIGGGDFGAAEVVDSRLVDVLSKAGGGFVDRTLLVKDLARQARGDRALFERLTAELLQQGFLVSGDAWLGEVVATHQKSDRRWSHLAIGIPTAGRTAHVLRLLRSLEPYVATAPISELLVVNQDRQGSSADHLEEELARWGRSVSCRTRQVRPEHLERLASLLARSVGIDPSVLSFMLVPGPGRPATGAARNGVHLLSPSGPLLSLDDDIVTNIGRVEDACSVQFRSGGSFFRPTLGTEVVARQLTPVVDGAWIEELVGTLGRRPLELVAQRAADGWDVKLDGLTAGLIEELSGTCAAIAVVRPGMLGDSGLDNPLSYAWASVTKGRISEARLKWNELASDTQVARVETGNTIYAGPEFLSMAFGYVADESALPFFPVGRGQDGVWAAMNRCATPGWLQCSIPLCMEHRSTRAVYSTDIGEGLRELTWSECVTHLVEEASRGLSTKGGSAALALGRRLLEMSGRSTDDLKDLILPLAARARRTWLDRLEHSLVETGAMRYLHHEYQACESAAAQFLQRMLDDSHGSDPKDQYPTWPQLAKAMADFGSAMQVWPDIVQAAAGYEWTRRPGGTEVLVSR